MFAAASAAAHGPIAQWLEQRTHNPLVQGSSPCGPTSLRQGYGLAGQSWRRLSRPKSAKADKTAGRCRRKHSLANFCSLCFPFVIPFCRSAALCVCSKGATLFISQSAPKSKQDSNMEIKRSGSQPSGQGPADWFTGTVRIDPLFQANAPARAVGASVTFEPSARTAWHTHPLGQTLIVTAGDGRVQRWGGPIEEIRPGDVIWFPPGEKHWHGAAPTTAMMHIAVQEQLDGKAVDWMEKVSDEQYGC